MSSGGPGGGSTLVQERYAGPPGVANGGVVAGMLAGEGPAEVTIMRPVPVDAPLTASDGQLLDAGGTLLAEATPLSADAQAELEEAALAAPRRALGEARAAAAATPLADGHPFPLCFGCGRDHPDGLHCLAGPAGDGVWAVTFRPESDDPRLAWAALDCPSSAPHAVPNPTSPLVLGRIAGWILRPPETGEDHVVVAWSLSTEGRRRWSGSAILTADGIVCAIARAAWVALDAKPGVA